VTIAATEAAPTANPGGPYTGTAGTAIAFTGSANDPSSVDSSGGFTYAWNFGDGGTSTLQNPTHTYATAGTYTVTFTATDDGGPSSAASTRATVSDSGGVIIDSSWLTAHGPAPYILNQANTVYTLATDVTAAGTAFAMIANNITFNLNGHTITYDNASPIVVPNGSFEQGTGSVATGWDFSHASNASRFQGQYLQNQLYTGSYSLRFAVPAPDQYVTSTSTITLNPNTTYTLTGMIEYGDVISGNPTVNPGVATYISLVPVSSGIPTRQVSWNQTNWRGIQLTGSDTPFTTGPTAETYHVVIGITRAGSVAATNVYVDDIKLQQTNVYGVAVAAPSWESQYYPGIQQYGISQNSIVSNGSILQGADNATWGHGIRVSNGNGTLIDRVNITVQGANTSAVYWDYGLTSTISNCVLTSNVLTTSNRDEDYGVMVGPSFSGLFYNNTLLNGPLSGIETDPGTTSQVYNNTFSLKTKYTNAFCILLQGPSSTAHDNTIACDTGTYAARGINPSGSPSASQDQLIYNNTIGVRLFNDDQEYGGPELGGVYGIRLKNAQNVEIYGNNVTAIAAQTDASAFRAVNDVVLLSNIYVHNNTFTVVRSSTNVNANSVKLESLTNTSMVFQDNTLVTNDNWADCLGLNNVTLTRTTLMLQGDTTGAGLIVSESWDPSNANVNLLWQDNIYSSATVRSLFENTAFHTPSGGTDPNSSFIIGWTTNISVVDGLGNPVANATVTIANGQGVQVYSGITSASGQLSTVLYQLKTMGSTKTNFNSFELTVNLSGQIVTQAFDVNNGQTLSVVI
jgi:hypothetical protein